MIGVGPLYAPRGVVATSQPLAASAGVGVLRRGGNAIDAAIATAIALTVLQPPSNDIGGDLFAIVWDGQRLHGLNASGRAPAALTRDAVLAAGGGRPLPPSPALGGAQAEPGPHGAMPARGWLSVTVPGAPAGWADLHDRFGHLPYADLFADAIGYAEHGYPVSPRVADSWARGVRAYAEESGPEFAPWGRVFTVEGGRAPRPGERWRNPDAARALRAIAADPASLYTGVLAEAIAAHAAATGGLLSTADLAAHASTWVDPIGVDYRGHRVWELPPNGQGLAALIALGILDGVDLAALPEPERLHWQIEAVKLGFADAHAYVADPRHAAVPVDGLLNPAYLARRRALVGAEAGTPAPGEPARGGTVYLCTADAAGRMVSLIQSNYQGFGSYVTVPGFGFGLQNRGAGFDLNPRHPNCVAPGKRPYHTIIPGFLTRGGEPVGPFGVMGGHMQPQGHVQLISRTLDDGLNPQSALRAPRWYWHAGRVVLLEPGLSGFAAALRGRGHDPHIEEDQQAFGYGQAIWRLPSGGYVAGSEPRADGCASGY